MTETAETPPGGETPIAAEAGAKAERPEWLADDPHGYWDADKGELRGEALYQSFQDTKRLIGSRVGDLGPEARRKLAEALPDTLKETWTGELRARLGEDAEFLAPLEEKWKSAHLKAAPEAYEVPQLSEERGFDPEHALYGKAVETAKRLGLDQAAFGEVMGLLAEAQADQAAALSGATTEQWKASVPDLEQRANVVNNRLKVLAPEHGQALLEQVRDPNAFLALEAVIKATSAKPLALEPVQAPEQITQAKLDEMMNDPRYWDSTQRDPAYHAMVTKHFGKLYGDTL